MFKQEELVLHKIMEVEYSEIKLLYEKRCFHKYMLSNGQSLPWIMQQIKNRKVIVLIFTLRWDTKTFHKSRTDRRLATPSVFHGIHHLYSTEYRRKLLALGWQITKQLSGFLTKQQQKLQIKETCSFPFVINTKKLLNR